ncbi:MAG: type 1 glutamine amidotransferase [Burkholderiales bacterium]|nr:type 1 glutamine amidotransferase [Burkholderiales bacterium]
MKPVAIFRHSPTEGPAYFATYLERNKIPYRIIGIDAGEAVPSDASAFAGLCFMGGPMSVNDDLPWIEPVCSLIRDAVARDVPVLGHCLGGQLMAKALGAPVTRNPVKEIGWGEVEVLQTPEARQWLGEDLPSFLSFHWHGETFAVPEDATRIMASAACPNQAFAMGKHFGMQCHVEMTVEMIRAWCRDWAKEVEVLAGRVASVQTPAEMEQGIDDKVRALNAVADRIYDRWVEGLVK